MAATHNNFLCRSCGGTKAKDTGDGMLHCTTCGMQTLAASAAQRSPETPTAATGAPARNSNLRWRRLFYIPMFFSMGLTGYYLVQAFRSGNLSKQLPNVLNPNGAHYHWSGSDHGVYVGNDQKPGMFIIGERRMNTGRRTSYGNGYYLIFYRLPDYAEVHTEALKLSNFRSAANRFVVSPAGNGLFYALLDGERLFRINSANFSLEEVTATLRAHPELAGGAPTIKALSNTPTACFEVETAAGKKIYYDPAINKIYASLEEVSSGSVSGVITDTAVGFAFSRRSILFPKAPTKLIRYVVAKSENSVAPLPYFSWQRATTSSPFDKEAKPVLSATGKVRHFEDFNPGRPYYKARVLYWDKDLVLLISAKQPERDALQMLQALDANTGVVRFTLPLPGVDYPTDVVRYPEGYLLKDVASVLIVSNSGVLIKELKIQ